MDAPKYCADCGNTGFLPNGDKCPCGILRRSEREYIQCMSVPEEYRDIRFNVAAVPEDCGAAYASFLEDIHSDILRTDALKCKNLFISSPLKHSKTVFAYSCIQQLFKRDIEVFPLFDTGEVWNILQCLDTNKKSVFLQDLEATETGLLTVPYLFVKVTDNLSFTTFDAITELVDRRMRRGHGTIFLSNNRWNYVVAADSKKRIANLNGDGFFGTVKVHDFSPAKGGEDSES